MNLRSPLFLAALTVLTVGCASSQQQEAQSYAARVLPIAESLSTEADAFDVAMSNPGAPDQAALGSIRGSLQSSVDALNAIEIQDPEIKAAHAHLIAGVEQLRDTVDMVIAAVKNPAAAPADLEAQVDAMVQKANVEIDTWQANLESLFPEEETESNS